MYEPKEVKTYFWKCNRCGYTPKTDLGYYDDFEDVVFPDGCPDCCSDDFSILEDFFER